MSFWDDINTMFLSLRKNSFPDCLVCERERARPWCGEYLYQQRHTIEWARKDSTNTYIAPCDLFQLLTPHTISVSLEKPTCTGYISPTGVALLFSHRILPCIYNSDSGKPHSFDVAAINALIRLLWSQSSEKRDAYDGHYAFHTCRLVILGSSLETIMILQPLRYMHWYDTACNLGILRSFGNLSAIVSQYALQSRAKVYYTALEGIRRIITWDI